MTKLVKSFVSGVALLASSTALAGPCKKSTFAEYEAALAKTNPATVVFFASWCGACREDLERANDGKTLVIAAFDEADAAEKTLTALGVKAPCLLDDGIATKLGVTALPFHVKRR